ncbi:hypothetical protein AK812_SmicGene4776 [Symbiodinium microadriaticum]|uniref:Uncharacterized protein n=1 Tax=Symbiodinium microadriaticum TaxID=2951 RepID=A0A1Q9EVF1_SYMMI|nr:hypothetical protein AK812_SmicGene4776 [Symbiodinium microadriaticum]
MAPGGGSADVASFRQKPDEGKASPRPSASPSRVGVFESEVHRELPARPEATSFDMPRDPDSGEGDRLSDDEQAPCSRAVSSKSINRRRLMEMQKQEVLQAFLASHDFKGVDEPRHGDRWLWHQFKNLPNISKIIAAFPAMVLHRFTMIEIRVRMAGQNHYTAFEVLPFWTLSEFKDRLVSHWLWQEDRVDAFTVVNLKEPTRGQNTKMSNFQLPYFVMYDNLLTSLHFDEQSLGAVRYRVNREGAGVEVFGIRWIELAVLLVQIVKFLEVNASDLLDEGSCLDAALAGEPGAFRFYFGADDDHVLLLGHDVLQRLRVEGEDAVADVWAAFVVCHRQVWFGVVGGVKKDAGGGGVAGGGSSTEVVYPIHLASQLGNYEVVRMLVIAKANPRQKTSKMRSALDFAQEAADTENKQNVIDLLRGDIEVMSFRDLMACG